ncbi:FAD-dependent oxidoreductase [Flavobacterium rhizosphaerae]|uniref:FAD-dependent oxidoreductase n=1 Tax=Flavobacterium rhizosphaerae TaxID=3163298 RepID=A0ABW8YVT0_9FLAO
MTRLNDDSLVVIGGDAAGMSAASKVRRVQPDRKIIVFEKTSYTSYSACGIPYFISGTITDCDALVRRSPEEFRNKYNIDVHTQHLVTKVDTANKRIKVHDTENNREFWQEYGQLLIATGAKAYCPDVKGNSAENVFGISTLRSGIRVEKYIRENKPGKAVIIGGGYIGLEMAEALLMRGLKVSIVTRGSQVMDTLDPDMGIKISDAIKSLGINLYLNEEFKHFELDNDKVNAVVTTNNTIDADIVILGMGSAPNTTFLADSGIALGVKGAIKVNGQMQTNIPDVWAAGDCTETLNLVSKQQFYIALGTVANKTGLVAGTNLAGEKITFPGVVGTAVCKLCKYEVARTGLQEKELKKLNIEYVATTIDSTTRADYFPGNKKITVKLLAEKNSGRLLGGQIVGEEDAAKRIDVLAVAITHNLTLQNLIDMDLSYAPPFSPVWDPVQTCARKLIKYI